MIVLGASNERRKMNWCLVKIKRCRPTAKFSKHAAGILLITFRKFIDPEP